MSLSIPDLVGVSVMAPIGVIGGVLYFAALRRAVASLALRGAMLPAIAFTVARGAVAIAVLGVAAWLGAWPLLAAFAGFLVARWLAMRQIGRPS